MRNLLLAFLFIFVPNILLCQDISDTLKLEPIHQITPRHCWAACAVMCINFVNKNTEIKEITQEMVIKKISPDCDISENCFRKIKNIKFIKDECQNKCIERLPPANSKVIDKTILSNKKTIDSIIKLSDFGNLKTIAFFSDSNLFHKDSLKFNDSTFIKAIKKEHPLLAITVNGNSLHIIVIYGYRFINNQLVLKLHDPYPHMFIKETNRGVKRYWEKFSTEILYNSEKDGNSKNIGKSRHLKDKETYTIASVLEVYKK